MNENGRLLHFLCFFVFSSAHFTSINNNTAGYFSNQCKDREIISNNFFGFAYDGELSLSNKELILISSNSHTLSLALNVIASIGKTFASLTTFDSILVEVLIIAHDMHTIQLCDSMHLPCWYPNMLNNIISNGESSFIRQKLFNFNFIILNLLQLNTNIFVTDVDVVWLKSPYHFIQSTPHDIIIREDMDLSYYHVRSSQYSKKIFEVLHTGCLNRERYPTSQQCLQMVYQNIPNYFTILNSTYFPDACNWTATSTSKSVASPTSVKESSLPSSASFNAYMFHTSCKLSFTAKMQRLYFNNMIYIPLIHSIFMESKHKRNIDVSVLKRIQRSLMSVAHRSHSLVDFFQQLQVHL